jgi:hypothetical protein
MSLACCRNRPSDCGGYVSRIQYPSNPKALRITPLQKVTGLVSRKTRYSICSTTGHTVPLIRLANIVTCTKDGVGPLLCRDAASADSSPQPALPSLLLVTMRQFSVFVVRLSATWNCTATCSLSG